MSVLNKKAFRERVLTIAKETRHHKFTQVAGSLVHDAEVHMDEWIKNKVASQPSKGKTIR